MVRHLRRLLQRAAVFQIRRDPRRPDAVIAEPGRDPGRGGAAADHRVGVRLGRGVRVNSQVPQPIVRNSGPPGSSARPAPSMSAAR